MQISRGKCFRYSRSEDLESNAKLMFKEQPADRCGWTGLNK